MANPRFGLNVVHERTELGQLLFTLTQPVTGTDLDILLNESYEQSYGLFDHDSDAATPFSIVSMHPTEQYTVGSPLYNMLGRYLKHPIKERFGLSFTEFMSLPREFTEEIFRLSALGEAAKPSETDEAIAELERKLRE